MNSSTCDVAIIGAGTAGLAAWRAAQEQGARAILINAGSWDTTCVRTGCMPSKLLLAAANAARDARAMPEFGVNAGAVTIDGRAVMRRLHKIRDRLIASIRESVAEIPQSDRMQGQARFIAPDRLQVDGGTGVTFRAAIIATGSSAAIPPGFACLGDRVLTNENIFELDDLPSSIAVLGAGSLGLELGAAFTRLGVRTTIFDQSEQIGGLHDKHVLAAARDAFASELDMRLGCPVQAKPADGGLTIAGSHYEFVLVAAGRPPNLQALDLQRAGLVLDEHGTPVHDTHTMQCGDHPIFLAGDAAHDLPVLHEASRTGRLAGRNAAQFPHLTRETPPVPLSIAFTSPDIAVIGDGGRDDDHQRISADCAFDDGRALVDHRTAGLMRLFADRSDGRVAGAEMVAPGAEHLAHLIAAIIQAGMTVRDALRLPFYHPVLEENVQKCLRGLERQLTA